MNSSIKSNFYGISFPPFLSDYRLYYYMIIWLTGQPGSGKTTLAKELLAELRNDFLKEKLLILMEMT